MGFAALIKTFTACHSRVYAAYRIQFRVYTVSCRAEPDKAGGWGCNPHTENTRCIQFYTGPRPNESNPSQTKKKSAISGKAKVSWAYSDDKKHLQHVIPAFPLFPLGQSPIRPGDGGATPTLKIHDVSNSTPRRIQTNPNKTKQKLRQTEKQKFETKTGFFRMEFLFMGLQPLKPCLITLTVNG